MLDYDRRQKIEAKKCAIHGKGTKHTIGTIYMIHKSLSSDGETRHDSILELEFHEGFPDHKKHVSFMVVLRTPAVIYRFFYCK